MKKWEVKEIEKVAEDQIELIKKYTRKERQSKEERDLQLAMMLSMKTIDTKKIPEPKDKDIDDQEIAESSTFIFWIPNEEIKEDY